MAEKFIDIESISELHEYYRCGKPKHPLITVIDLSETNAERRNVDAHISAADKHTRELIVSNTHSRISEIAYGPGFDHPSHFTKLFKTRSGMTPTEFRNTFVRN